MIAYLRNTSTYVWAFLTLITIASWWIGRGTGAAYAIDGAITGSVLLLAFIKSRLVIRHFMEVRFAPAWLQWTCDGWLIFVFLMLIGLYRLSAV
jgi:Prokaryotic Cytochrome C oxidase subunit IV